MSFSSQKMCSKQDFGLFGIKVPPKWFSSSEFGTGPLYAKYADEMLATVCDTPPPINKLLKCGHIERTTMY